MDLSTQHSTQLTIIAVHGVSTASDAIARIRIANTELAKTQKLRLIKDQSKLNQIQNI